MAAHIRPTIVFFRLQRAGTPITPKLVETLRPFCAPDCVIAHWNGDQYEMAGTPEAAWMVELGRVCDTTLLVNSAEQAQLLAAGVRHPGFLAAGYDPDCYRPIEAAPRREVVCLASAHKSVAAYGRRNWLLEQFVRWGDQCVLYGKGWNPAQVRSCPFVPRKDEAALYSAAAGALSISLHNGLERYTSDRLWRMLGCGAVALVERFPEMEALGLDEGVNCFIWRGWNEMGGLHALLDDVLRGYLNFCPVRQGALELAKLHTWEARALELLAIVDAVRAHRRVWD